MGFFKNLFVTKHPTVKEDAIAYTSGSGKEFNSDYNDYLTSVETLDKAVRVIANVASMASMGVYREIKGELKPYKIKNIDLEYGINEQDAPSDFIRKVFSSIFTQGASIIIAEKNTKTSLINFYAYDPAVFDIEASESAMISNFKYTSKSGETIDFKPEDVIYTNTTIDVTNLVYAVSRLKPLNDMLTLQANIMKQTSDYYSSGSKDSVIISPKEPMSATNAETLKETFNTFIQSRQTKTLFLNTELDIKSVSNAQTPSDIMNALSEINNIIIQSFGIPPYLYGDVSGYVNDAAIVTSSRLFFEIQLKPVFKSFEYQMTKYFRNTLGLKNAIVKFNFDDIEILQDNLTMKIENASKLYKLGILSLNEARKEAELDELPDEAANNHFLPAYLVSDTPVSIENFEQAMADIRDNTEGNTNSASPTSEIGGNDNEESIV